MFDVHCKMLDGEPQMFPTCYFQHRAVLIEGWQYQQQQQLVLPVLVEGQLWLGEGWTFRQMSLRGVWLWKKKTDDDDYLSRLSGRNGSGVGRS